MTARKKTKVIYFVDDEPMIRKAVSASLSSLPDIEVHCFASGEECLQKLKQDDCDLLITDISMPGMDGIELLQKVKSIHPRLPVLVVTGYGDIPITVKAVQAGAIDFIEKPLDENTFLPIIMRIIDKQRRSGSSAGHPLTKAEMKVLQMVADGNSNKEIAYSLHRSVRTIENHRHRLMRKLHIDNTAGLVKIAIAMGMTVSLPATDS
jgi:FixJ family two-component response regulator